MVVLALVNMLLLLVGFLTGLRKKSSGPNQGMPGAAANQACLEQTH